MSDAADLRALLDKQAIYELIMAYCNAADRHDHVKMRTLYHEDAIDDHGVMFKGGPDEYVAWLPSMMANWAATVHSITNMLFLIDGNRAEGELQTVAYHRTQATPQREIIAGGRYLDVYEKREGVWRFFRRSLVLDWFEDRALQRRDGPAIDDGVEGFSGVPPSSTKASRRPGAGSSARICFPLFNMRGRWGLACSGVSPTASRARFHEPNFR